MKIALATDHAGFAHKEILKSFLVEQGHEVVDSGAYVLDANDDYPAFMKVAAEKVARGDCARGIILGGSGQGEAMVANRLPSIRAVVYYGGPLEIVTLSREHNDANILSLGARFLSHTEVCEAADLWLDTSFSGEERHLRRIQDIDGAGE
jgi:ribose 5-phosphate isomerase B